MELETVALATGDIDCEGGWKYGLWPAAVGDTGRGSAKCSSKDSLFASREAEAGGSGGGAANSRPPPTMGVAGVDDGLWAPSKYCDNCPCGLGPIGDEAAAAQAKSVFAAAKSVFP